VRKFVHLLRYNRTNARRKSRGETAEIAAAPNFLDKIRNVRYVFPLTESTFQSPAGGREGEKPWLFEMFAYNPSREPGRRRNFLFFSRATY
jgi:hypothetical protein